MVPYPYKDPAYFTTVDAVLEEIDRILAHLESQTVNIDDYTRETDQLVWYGNQVQWLKLYYERAERLMLNES
jgi:hypothetical protein